MVTPARQKGVALVAVLLIFALIAVLAAGMINRQRLHIQQSLNLRAQGQAYQYALAVETFARQRLVQDFEQDRRENRFVDSEQELSRSIVYGEAAFVLEGQLDDMQARFNINSLVGASGQVDQNARKRFEDWLFSLGITDFRVDALVDWLDTNTEAGYNGGAEDEAYLVKDPPYRAGNGPMAHVSELLLVEGMTREIYDLLEPHIAALPPGVKQINVNTASATVLRSLDPRITQQQAEAIVKARPADGFATLQEFLQLPELAALGLQAQQDYMSVNSQYYLLTARAIVDERSSRLVSLLRRNAENGKVEVLWRDQGQKYAVTKEVIRLQ